MRNGPNTTSTLSLPILSEVRVWREKDGWNGPYKLLAINGEKCTIDMPHGPTNFRSTVVKPYYAKEEIPDVPEQEDQVNRSDNEKEPNEETEPVNPEPTVRRGRGRPKGSRNKDVSNKETTVVRRSTRHHLTDEDNFDQAFLTKEIDI